MIGVAVTTVPDRMSLLRKTIEQWELYMPKDAILFVYNDVYRQGIPRAKNECLKYLYNKGVEHFFLSDDDCFPISDEWWKPYVNHPEPHLMYQFKLPSKPITDMEIIYRDSSTVAYTHTRGAMIYVQRIVLDTVGGMDTDYGTGMFEHPDWTNRIHNAGLTTHRAMDVPNSKGLFYCYDQDKAIQSSISGIKRRNTRKNAILYKQNRLSKAYKEFR